MISINPFTAIESLILSDFIDYIHFIPFSFNEFADIPEILDFSHHGILTGKVKDNRIVAAGFHGNCLAIAIRLGFNS